MRILWLAVAEGRGHLVRAALAHKLLAPAGIDVELVTTSVAGAAFAAELGMASDVMSSSYRLIYDHRQNLARARTRAMAMTYLLAPTRCLRDIAWLEGRAAGAALIVNDSFHPAALAACAFGADIAHRIVHVHTENTRRAVEDTAGRGPIRALIARSFAQSRRIEMSPDAAATGSERLVRLPPLLPAPRDRDSVRASHGIAAGERLACVYLNPYFDDPALADALDAELAAAGYRVRAVGEGYAQRAGWRARDPSLAELAAAADLFISAPGSGALALARSSGVPMIALATDQPEQRKNLASDPGSWRYVVDLCARGAGARRERTRGAGDDLAARLRAAIAQVPPATVAHDRELAVRRARSLWLSTFTALVGRKEPS